MCPILNACVYVLTIINSQFRSDRKAYDCSLALDFSTGRVNLKDQLREYRYRGVGLSSMSMLEFILNTYEGQMLDETPAGQKRKLDGTRAAGRPPNERHEYLPAANKGKSCRVVRSAGHETIPKICGSWFARSDRPAEQDMHRATMLTLMVPWRNLHEIKNENETFENRYRRMLEAADDRCRTFINNAQYYHECLDGAKEKEAAGSETGIDLAEECTKLGMVNFLDDAEHETTEADIDLARITRTKARERLYGEMAIDTAIEHNIFSEDVTDRSGAASALPATDFDMRQIEAWEKQLVEHNRTTNRDPGITDYNANGTAESEPTILRDVPPAAQLVVVDNHSLNDNGARQHEPDLRTGLGVGSRHKLAMLNADQRRAHDIIEERLQQHLRGETSLFGTPTRDKAQD